jgi:hypothetical protein
MLEKVGDDAQIILDQMITNEKSREILSPFGYLHKLIQEYLSGTLVLTAASRVKQSPPQQELANKPTHPAHRRYNPNEQLPQPSIPDFLKLNKVTA